MAGKRQHFIPQFLQKGFASHTVGGEVFTWVYRKGLKPFNTNTKNVGVEGLFYSEDKDSRLDDAITAVEGEFAQLVDSVRLNWAVDKTDYERVAQLFAHLAVRTRHLRQNFFAIGNCLINEMLEFLSDPASCENFLRRKIINDSTLMKESFSEELKRRGLPQDALPLLMRLSEPFMELTMPNMVSSFAQMAVYLKSEMPKVLKQASKTGHIKALTRGLAPDVRVDRYKELNFQIHASEDFPLLLGDSAVIFHVSGDRCFKPFLEKGDNLVSIILPISPRQVIVGSKGKYVPNFSDLRRVIGGCSLEYFISNEIIPENDNLSSLISSNAHLLTKSEIEELLENVMNEKSSNNSNSADAKSRTAD